MVLENILTETIGTGAYSRPTDLSDALQQMGQSPAAILAGGTDLVLLRAERMIDPSLDILDIKGIANLRGTRKHSDGSTVIGAATTLQQLATTEPRTAITDGAALVGGWQTRARATLGGNVCRASPAGDTLPGTLVVSAQFRLESATGSRLIAARDFFLGPGRCALEPGELLTEVIVPGGHGASAYQRFTYRRAMDLAVVGVAVHVEIVDGHCTAAAVALGAAAPTPVLAPEAAESLIGTTLDEASIEKAANLVLRDASPIDDGRGSRRHRLHVLPVLTRRALQVARSRVVTDERGGEANV